MTETIETICRYLMYWDPIGIIQDSVSKGVVLDEYDSYAEHIYDMLSKGKTAKELELHLIFIAKKQMRMKPNGERCRITAESLYKFFHRPLKIKKSVRGKDRAKGGRKQDYIFEVMVISNFCLNQMDLLNSIVKSTKDKSLKKQVMKVEDAFATLYQLAGHLLFEIS